MKNRKTAENYAENCLKPPKAFYEWCYYNMPTYKWENKQKTIIGSARKHSYTYEKRLAKNSRLTFFDRKDHYQIILSTSKRIEIQTYEVVSFFEEGVQQFRVKLVNLEHFSNDEHIKVGAISDKKYKFGLITLGCMVPMYYQRKLLYSNKWLERLTTVSELRYLKIDSMYDDEIAFFYKYRHRIEYAQRINAPKLAEQISRKQLDMRTITMQWLKRNKTFFRNTKRTFQTFELKQALASMGIKYIAGVEEFMSADDVSKIPNGVKLITFQNYLIKQKKNIRYYRDYINVMNDLKLPITSMNRLPKDLEKAHDKAVATLNAMKREIVRQEFRKRAKEEAFLEMSIKNIQFLLPKEANDLIEEGKSLEHCVGGSSYIDEHANGETTIVFVRTKSEPDKPYYTIEYKNSKVRQISGFNNKKPDEQLRETVAHWLDEVKKRENLKEKKHVA